MANQFDALFAVMLLEIFKGGAPLDGDDAMILVNEFVVEIVEAGPSRSYLEKLQASGHIIPRIFRASTLRFLSATDAFDQT